MQNYPFNFETLFSFSNQNTYTQFTVEEKELLENLDLLKEKFNFPAVNNDVGNLIHFFIQLQKPKIIFEMGSGYGHSCFWYHLKTYSFIEKIYLTEKRDDLSMHFKALPWPGDFFEKLDYHQGDAFDKLNEVSNIDFLLIDGVKADYLKFLESSYEKLSENCLILIDNSFWRGSFLDEKMLEKKSSKHIKSLHDYLANTTLFQSVFVPFKDGVSLLRKLPA